MTDVPVYLTPKRKRGRPRKDANIFKDNSFKLLAKPHIRQKLNAYKNDGMVGTSVYGVIEGSFDAGFLISVRTSNNCTPFRGVIFQSDKVVPVTPANDLAPDVKMYQRREIPAAAYTLPSQFNCNSPISPCRAQTSIAPYDVTSHSTFSVTEQTEPKVAPCFNVGGNITPYGNPRLVNNKPSSACPVENLGIIEHDESSFGFNMNNMVKTGDVVSESSFESMLDSFLGNDMKPNMRMQNKLSVSPLELHHNFASQIEFETWQNATVVNQCVWQIEPQVINSELDITDMYHCDPNLNLNFHQNLFTYPSQHGSQEQPKCPASNFYQHAFNEGISTSPNLQLNLATVKQEQKPIQDNAHVETKYVVPFFQSPETETNTALNSILETCERFHKEDGTSLAEPGSALKDESVFKLEVASVQSTTERMCVKQTSPSIDSITDMDYVLSDVVSFVEPHCQFWETKLT